MPEGTERLVFRTWQPEDEEIALALWGDPQVTALVGGPFDRARVRQMLDAEREREREHGVQYWPIFLRDGGHHAGCCGLRPRDPAGAVYEIGFHLRPERWGAGLAVEAGRAAIAHAFSRLGARALFAGHHPDNRSSRRVLDKLGMTYTHDELYPPTGLQHPCYLLAAADWRG